MNRKERNKARKILRRNLIAGTLLLFLLGLSIAGATGAWFTNGSITLQNIFTAGTVLIDVTEENTSFHDEDGILSADTLIVPHGGYINKSFNIENIGTKSIYIRAYFEGYWDRLYHKNTATVTATAVSGTYHLEDSDSVHFYYETGFANQYFGYNPTFGFTANNYNLPRTEIKFGDPEGIENETNGNTNGNNGSGDGNLTNSCGDPIDWPEPIFSEGLPLSGRGIKPELFTTGTLPAGDPHPNQLVGLPTDCLIYVSKKHPPGSGDNDQTLVFEYKDGQWHEIDKYNYADFDFYLRTIEPYKGYAGFGTVNKSVYYAYAKGGPDGHLYSYYPQYPSGVSSDCWLTQPRDNYDEGNISHLTIYYCEKPPKPAIEITKEVSFDGGTNWLPSDKSSPIPIYSNSVAPQFRFKVENTGNVVLNNVKVTDDLLDFNPGGSDPKVWHVGTLYPKAEAEPDQYKDYYKIYILDSLGDWWSDFVSTEHVVIKLCNRNTSDGHSHGNYEFTKWVPELEQKLPVYFYHKEKLTNNYGDKSTVDLCVKIYIKDGYEDLYKGSTLIINSYFEAVQASNNMIWHNWKDDLEQLDYTKEFGWWNN